MNRNSPDHSAALQPPPPLLPIEVPPILQCQSHHAGSPATAQNCFQNLSRPSLLPPPENLGRYFESLWPVMRRRRLLCAVASMLPTFSSQSSRRG